LAQQTRVRQRPTCKKGPAHRAYTSDTALIGTSSRESGRGLGSALAAALEAYAGMVEGAGSGMSAFIDAGLATLRPKLTAGSWKQYKSAARHLKTAFKDFTPNHSPRGTCAG
jgi:hypothetical protein